MGDNNKGRQSEAHVEGLEDILHASGKLSRTLFLSEENWAFKQNSLMLNLHKENSSSSIIRHEGFHEDR